MNEGDEEIRVLAMGKLRGIKRIKDWDFIRAVAVDKAVVEMIIVFFFFFEIDEEEEKQGAHGFLTG